MKNSKFILPVLSLCLLSACATTVTNKHELFANDHDASQKNCYSYDTVGRSMARSMPTSIGLGIVGGLFPPLMIIAALGAGASAAAGQAALPVKCGLTLDEAVKEAQDSSFYEDATATWVQKDGRASIRVEPLSISIGGECSMHRVIISRTSGGVHEQKTKNFTQDIEICKNEDAMAVVTQEHATLLPSDNHIKVSTGE